MSKSDIVSKLNSLPPSHHLQSQAAIAIERLREEVSELERRLDLPALIREASEVYGQELKLHQFGDGSGSLRSSFARVVAWGDFNQAQPIIDFIKKHKTPPLAEQLHDGARVKLRNGDECVIYKARLVWRCGPIYWDREGRYAPFVGQNEFDIVEVLS